MIDSVIMNPPYSVGYSGDKSYAYDSRFTGYPLAPKSKADYMFLLDGLNRLSENGTMSILLPHGVLFRGGAEAEIRKKLLDVGVIDSIIGLPTNLFASTGIPTVALVLKKGKRDNLVFFIDASNEFVKEKAVNVITPENLEKIKNTWFQKKQVDKFSRLVSYEELQENDFNLNIPRYINNREKKPSVDIVKELKELKEIEMEIEQTRRKLELMSKELISVNKSDELKALLGVFSLDDYEDIPDRVYISAEVIEVIDEKTDLPTPEYQQLTMDMLDGIENLESGLETKINKLKKAKEFSLDNMFVGG